MNIVEVKKLNHDRSDLVKKKKPRLFFSIKNESIIDNFTKRASGIRPTWRTYKKLVAQALERAGLEATQYKARWSLKAGCAMCPCSPGFILDGPQIYQDIYATIDPESNGN